jgi:hypothetical protein
MHDVDWQEIKTILFRQEIALHADVVIPAGVVDEAGSRFRIAQALHNLVTANFSHETAPSLIRGQDTDDPNFNYCAPVPLVDLLPHNFESPFFREASSQKQNSDSSRPKMAGRGRNGRRRTVKPRG